MGCSNACDARSSLSSASTARTREDPTAAPPAADRLLPKPEHHDGVVDLWVQGMSLHGGVAPDVPSDAEAAEGPVGK
jgi:hypothetical protein